MEIKGTTQGETLIVELDGRLDTNTAPDLETYLKENMGGLRSLTLDLEHVQYVSSAGLRVFLYAHKELAKAGGALTLRKPNEYVMEVLEATGFTDILAIEH
ncbi:STAS domain-containing protein [Bifidobacterium sp. 64T4]|uniref:STAS domain-containing protein n=1 Tax=Bifidobacterium pongonis TaxID=2834432 RepID=UPI001C5A0B88|nr:STAS domain-containing protein [Bifidobacterium pongonis]MBW3094229.1 STAS domain-containing protein [Bifidobacterium pongonis]